MRENTQQHRLMNSPAYLEAKKSLLKAISEQSKNVSSIRPPVSNEVKLKYDEWVKDFAKRKGRDQYFNYLSSGLGHGPFIELLDGSVKMDLITGIGINFFGHSHPELMSELTDAISTDTMQGNLQPGYESEELIKLLLSNVGEKSRLKHAWLFCSGTMSNETALKIIRQKKAPATRIFAFNECFAGRSTAMQEITDNPKYRVGQPTYGEVAYLPFYSPTLSLEENVKRAVDKMNSEMSATPGKFAGLMLELIQGEGGIRFAPREWYIQVFTAAKNAGLAIWFDEIQTFGRTEKLFAYQHFGLEEWPDVVTIGKMLHACAALYTEEMNPQPGLVAGTFTGSGAALKTGRRVLELLTQGGYYGEDGKIAHLSRHFVRGLEKLKAGSCAGLIGEIRAIGGMIGFGVWGQTMDETKKFLSLLFDEGVVAFFAGHDPYVVRCLPPFGVMDTAQIDEAMKRFEKILLVGKK